MDALQNTCHCVSGKTSNKQSKLFIIFSHKGFFHNLKDILNINIRLTKALNNVFKCKK